MSFIQVGDLVRIYYEEQCFDEGEVISVSNDVILVDFYDWIEQWHDGEFILEDLFYEGIEVLVPIQRGIIVVEYRS